MMDYSVGRGRKLEYTPEWLQWEDEQIEKSRIASIGRKPILTVDIATGANPDWHYFK